jgi:hypothetical protein
MERYNAITSILVRKGQWIYATSRIGVAIPCIAATIAYRCILVGCRTRSVDSQVENLEAIATMDGLSLVLVGATCGVCLTMPLVTVAGGSSNLYRITIVDSQMECDDAIATVRRGGGIYVIARGGISLAIPCVTIASSSGKLGVLCAVNGQVEYLEAIATMDGSGLILVRA